MTDLFPTRANHARLADSADLKGRWLDESGFGATPLRQVLFVEKLSIALTPEMTSVVREAVDTGEYASSSEVIREALRDWQRKGSPQPQEIEEIRRLWSEGIASGPSHHADMVAIRAEAQRHLRQDEDQT